MDLNLIKVWRFNDAPRQYKDLAFKGKDPEAVVHSSEWLIVCPSVSIYGPEEPSVLVEQVTEMVAELSKGCYRLCDFEDEIVFITWKAKRCWRFGR